MEHGWNRMSRMEWGDDPVDGWGVCQAAMDPWKSFKSVFNPCRIIDMEDGDLTYQIIGGAMRVHTELGPGLREKPYENGLAIDLEEQGLDYARQPRHAILYHNRPVGDCQPDLVVEDEVVVDCKSISKIGENEIGQMLNYLRILKKDTGLTLNFQPVKLEVKRVVL